MAVLLCDDEPSIRLLFRTAVEQLGFDVVEVPTGEGCLAAVVEQAPEAVILDLYLGDDDGLALLPRLVAARPNTPIFVVSAHASRDVFEEALGLGASACFEKLLFLERLPQLLGSARTSA